MVLSIDYDRSEAQVQKLVGGRLNSKRYAVKLSEIYPASVPAIVSSQKHVDEDEGIALYKSLDNAGDDDNMDSNDDHVPLRRSSRERRHPEWLVTDEIGFDR